MYQVLLVSDDSGFVRLASKFIPHINDSISVESAATINAALTQMESNHDLDLVIIDHGGINDMFEMLNSMGRKGWDLPVIITAKTVSKETVLDAFNTRVESFIERNKREPMGLFTEIDQRIVLAVEKKRNREQRRINERRMEALVEMAKMGNRDFSSILNYALDQAISLTESEIGYVATFNRKTRMLRMLAWSHTAMKKCDVGSYSFEFNLDTTGIWGEPIRTGKTVIVNDYVNDNRLMKKGVPMGHVQLNKLLMVPIVANGELLGTAGVGNKKGDYTWFDEVQLIRMMEELFAIYSRIEKVRGYSGQQDVIRDMIQAGPVGLMYVTTNMDVVLMNQACAEALSCEPVMTSYVHLDDLESDAARRLRDAINASRMYDRDENIRLTVPTSDGERTYNASVTNMAGPGRDNPGFSVVLVDVTQMKVKDAVIGRAMEHIEILEGPVCNNLAEIAGKLDHGSPEAIILDNIIEFITGYSNVGIRSPIWFQMDDLMNHVRDRVDLGRVDLRTAFNGVRVFADPSLCLVFRNMINNSLVHGGNVRRIDIGFRISMGNLTIFYTDDGEGIPDIIRENIFDLTSAGKYGMFLVKKIVEASGFSISCPAAETGSRFEITVPASRYTLG